MLRMIHLAVLCALLPGVAHSACAPASFAVAVDAGHTPGSPGSTSARGKPEFEFNHRLAWELVISLHAAGYQKAFLVNPNKRELSLRDRTRMAERNGGDLFISIHHDSVQPHYLTSWTHNGQNRAYSDTFSGFSLFVSGSSQGTTASRLTAQAIGLGLVQRGLTPTLHHAEPIPGESRTLLVPKLGIYQRDTLAVLRDSRAPAVLVEAGVIVHRAEEQRLEQTGHRAKILAAIKDGVVAACAATPGGQ
jgi:N-acetylmuramoyl-L-alanine amidase